MAVVAGEYYLESGEALNFTVFERQIHDILKAHYEKVEADFQFRLRDDQKFMKQFIFKKADDEMAFSIAYELDLYNEVQATQSASEITKTNNREFQNALDQVINKYEEEGIFIDDDDIILEALEIFLGHADARAQTITTTETNKVAENAKYTEATMLRNNVETPLEEEIEEIKEWVAILDDRTREWHAEADGQEVNINEAFTVKGEKLMYPGDDSLGVSLDNIINCRCDAHYSFRAL